MTKSAESSPERMVEVCLRSLKAIEAEQVEAWAVVDRLEQQDRAIRDLLALEPYAEIAKRLDGARGVAQRPKSVAVEAEKRARAGSPPSSEEPKPATKAPKAGRKGVGGRTPTYDWDKARGLIEAGKVKSYGDLKRELGCSFGAIQSSVRRGIIPGSKAWPANRAPTSRTAPAEKMPPKSDTTGDAIDWGRAEQVWNETHSYREVAHAVGCSVAQVRREKLARGWETREREIEAHRPVARGQGDVDANGRTKLRSPVRCPSCEQMTAVDPCGNPRCNMKLPTELTR